MGRDLIFVPTAGPAAHHDAGRAWQRLGTGAPPASIESLTVEGVEPLLNSQVFRLVRSGQPPVIAKLAARGSLAVEVAVYSELLPGWAGVPRFLGAVDDDDAGRGWLFLEEARGERFHESRSRHPVALARTLVELHRSTIGRTRPASVPPLHASDRFRLVQLALERLAAGLANPLLTPDERSELSRSRRVVEQVRDDWPRLAAAAEAGQTCLVHSDLVGKNVIVGVDRAVLLDWAAAAWGVPAEDLASIDVPTYVAGLAGAWPGGDMDSVTRLGHAGSVLRDLSLIQATATGLAGQWVARSVRNIGYYTDRLSWRWARLA